MPAYSQDSAAASQISLLFDTMEQMTDIYVDGLGLVDDFYTGIGHYIAGILYGMDQLAAQATLAQKPFPRIYVIVPYDRVARFRKFGFQYIKYKTFPMSFRIMSGLWHREKLPPIDLICGKGVYVFPRFVDMPLAFSKSLIVIHDITFELHKEYTEDRNARFLSRTVHKSVARAAGIITVSENGRKEVIDFYKVKPTTVFTATPAVDRKVFYRQGPKKIAEVKQKYNIQGDYILFVGSLEPRKNIDGLVEAYTKLPRQITDKYSLLLVGVNGWKTEAIFGKIIDYYQQGYKIIRPSRYVVDEDIPALFSGATIFVLPAHYEGFGIPPLEALACGTPVITSNNSSLPEVVGKQAVLVNEKNTDEITEAMHSLLGDSKQRDKALIGGPEQAAKFSWIKSAQNIIDYAQEKIS